MYPNITRDAAGMQRLFKQFSFPGGIPSHVAPETPGSIHEGGELEMCIRDRRRAVRCGGGASAGGGLFPLLPPAGRVERVHVLHAVSYTHLNRDFFIASTVFINTWILFYHLVVFPRDKRTIPYILVRF